MSRTGLIPVLKYSLIQRSHRSQNSRFSGFQYAAGYVRCHHYPVAGAVRDWTWMRLSSLVWPALGCVSGASFPLSSASTPSPARRLRRWLRQGSVTTRMQLVVHLQKRGSRCIKYQIQSWPGDSGAMRTSRLIVPSHRVIFPFPTIPLIASYRPAHHALPCSLHGFTQRTTAGQVRTTRWSEHGSRVILIRRNGWSSS